MAVCDRGPLLTLIESSGSPQPQQSLLGLEKKITILLFITLSPVPRKVPGRHTETFRNYFSKPLEGAICHHQEVCGFAAQDWEDLWTIWGLSTEG